MNVRSVAAAFFLMIGSLLTIPASIAVWQERTILDEDNFVETATAVLDDEDVQVALASRMADAVMIRLDVNSRIDSAIVRLEESRPGDELPGLTVLEGPIVATAREAVYRICLRVLQSNLGSNARELVLRSTHRAFSALIKDDREYVETNGEQVVLNLRPLIDQAVGEVASDRVQSAISSRLDEDAGRIVLIKERNQTIVWKLLGWLDDFNPVIPLAALTMLALAVLLSHDRARMVGRTGIFLLVVSGLTLFVAASPLKDLLTSWPPREEGKEAAAAAYDILLDSFRRQELYLGVVGIGLVGVSAAAKEPAAIRAIRATQPDAARNEGSQGFRRWLVARQTVLRAMGFALTAIVLLFWPDPTERAVFTVLSLAAVYFGLLWVAVAEAPRAFSLREHAGRLLMPAEDERSLASENWVERWANALRLAGILVALGILVLAPDITYKLVLLVCAGALLYLAAIDYLASRAEGADEE